MTSEPIDRAEFRFWLLTRSQWSVWNGGTWITSYGLCNASAHRLLPESPGRLTTQILEFVDEVWADDPSISGVAR